MDRLYAVALRRPRSGAHLYEQLHQQAGSAGDAALALTALYGLFFVKERLGQGLELETRLFEGLAQAHGGHLPRQAAAMHEAIGRVHYQKAEYQQASQHWSQGLDLATMIGHIGIGVAARIGLSQIHYALGDWQTGHRLLIEASQFIPSLNDDYLESKLRLNLGVGLYNRQQYVAAEAEFERGLQAARRVRHQDYQAEALWHLARTAQGRGQHAEALTRCQEALRMADRLGYAWLQVMAGATLTELAQSRHDPAEAIRCGEESLQTARRIGARRQESDAHKALARLYQDEGQLAQALEHLWQHQSLEESLYKLSLPERLTVLSRYDSDHRPPEERLLELSNRNWVLEQPEDLRQAVQALAPDVQAILQVEQIHFWWDETGHGQFILQDAGLDLTKPPALDGAALSSYVRLLEQRAEPLVLPDLALHPCHGALSVQAEWVASQSRLEFALRHQGRLQAILWIAQHHSQRIWSREDVLRASHIAQIYERLLLALHLAQAKQAHAEAEQEKFASLGRMVASVAHDVNTPIGVAITAASGLTDGARRMQRVLGGEKVSRSELTALVQQISSSAELVERNLQRAATLIGDFKRVAVDQNAEQVMEFNLGDYIRSVVSVHSPALRKAKVSCDVDIDANILMTQTSGLLTQVFSNLIMNSINHAFPDGEGGRLTIQGRVQDGRAVIDYRDDGIGLSDEVRARIFEPFFTTKRGQGGSGLGMYIVYSIVQRLQGRLELPISAKGLHLRMIVPLEATS